MVDISRQQLRRAERQRRKQLLTSKSQFFEFTDEAGFRRRLDVEEMRKWADASLTRQLIDVDLGKVADMFENKRLDLEYLEHDVFKSNPKPILVCLNFRPGMSEIVDGNHSYAAVAIAAIKAREQGLTVPSPLRVEAYCFEREQWQRFLLG